MPGYTPHPMGFNERLNDEVNLLRSERSDQGVLLCGRRQSDHSYGGFDSSHFHYHPHGFLSISQFLKVYNACGGVFAVNVSLQSEFMNFLFGFFR